MGIKMSKHDQSGECPKCKEIIGKYPEFDQQLADWFYKLQVLCPIIHCSAAGRGEADQEAFFLRGASRAHYGQSAHNVNAALDLFFLLGDTAIWDLSKANELFTRYMVPHLENWIDWYGRPDAPFKELAHVEIRNWAWLVSTGKLVLVE
jgi:hypothetical protein